LLTRSDLVVDVVRLPSRSANRPGAVIHCLVPTASAIAWVFCFLVTGSFIDNVLGPGGALQGGDHGDGRIGEMCR
jgi:hypothetical protein